MKHKLLSAFSVILFLNACTSAPIVTPIPTPSESPIVNLQPTNTVPPTAIVTLTPTPQASMSIDIRKLTYRRIAVWENDSLQIDNSANDNWDGYNSGPLVLSTPFQVNFLLSMSGEFSGVTLDGKLGEQNLGGQNQAWWEGIRRMIVVPDGRIQFQDGLSDSTYEIRVNLPKNNPFQISFLDKQGKRIVFMDMSGKILKSLDVTSDIPGLTMPDGLFAEGLMYWGALIAPKSKLTISKFSFEAEPNEFYLSQFPPQQCALIIGEREEVVSKNSKEQKGFTGWPDGTMGVLKNGDMYTFIAAHNISPSKSVGNLDNPFLESSIPKISIRNPKGSYNYAAGGPIYKDSSGMLLMFYHAEKWPNGDLHKFISSIGLAKSVDDGNTWTDLGEIIKPETAWSWGAEVGGGNFTIAGDYFYVYFRDTLTSGDINLAVARAKIVDVITAAKESNNVVTWSKYYQGSWNESALGGKSSPLEFGNPGTRFFDVSYNEYLNKYIMVIAADFGLSTSLYYTESADGIAWSSRSLLDDILGENFYPTIIGLGEFPRVSGADFFIYYTYSQKGNWERWSDAILARRKISCGIAK
jgi:hypothetical protein